MAIARTAFTMAQHEQAVCLSMTKGGASPTMLNEFGATLMDLVDRSPSPRIVVDLSEVEFMPTAMLGHIIAASTKLRGKNGRISLVGANSHITGVFDVTRMKEHFDFHPTVEAAMSAADASNVA